MRRYTKRPSKLYERTVYGFATVMLFTTAFTPCTCFASFSACVLCFFVGRLPERVNHAVLYCYENPAAARERRELQLYVGGNVVIGRLRWASNTVDTNATGGIRNARSNRSGFILEQSVYPHSCFCCAHLKQICGKQRR